MRQSRGKFSSARVCWSLWRKVEPVGEFELKGIRRPLATYNVVCAVRGDEP